MVKTFVGFTQILRSMIENTLIPCWPLETFSPGERSTRDANSANFRRCLLGLEAINTWFIYFKFRVHSE